MERVVTINLNGNSYQLEEPAYDALRAYIARAEAALAANPDRAEIIRDLEQAIADKCASYLSASKSVVGASEMARVLEQMGPVDGDAGAQDQQADAVPREEAQRPPRRLYRIYDSNAWTGVSAGLAAYTGIDVAWMRALWILSALFTGGFTIIIYIVLIFAVPVASTAEELAAAHGAPFSAQEVIDRAKREYSRFAGEEGNWREQTRAWKRAMRERMRGYAPPPVAPAKPVGYATRMFAGFSALIFSIITGALLIAFLVVLFQILNTGAVFGWTPPGDVPNWLMIVVLCIGYAAISSPFSALRRSSYSTMGGRGVGGGLDALVTIALIAIALWVVFWYMPGDFSMAIDNFVDWVVRTWTDRGSIAWGAA